MEAPKSPYLMARHAAVPPSQLLSPRFVYHPAMLDAAKLSIKAIIFIVLFVLLCLSVSCLGCYLACWRRRARKRREARKLAALKGAQDTEETRRRWDKIFGRKKKEELELQSLGPSSEWSEVDLGLPKPKGARVREWKMWDMP